jgi:hypothetical protein
VCGTAEDPRRQEALISRPTGTRDADSVTEGSVNANSTSVDVDVSYLTWLLVVPRHQAITVSYCHTCQWSKDASPKRGSCFSIQGFKTDMDAMKCHLKLKYHRQTCTARPGTSAWPAERAKLTS